MPYDFLPIGVSVKAKAKDMRGIRLGKLTVKECVGKSPKGSLLWSCSCDCGSSRVLSSAYLMTGKPKSCGCWKNYPSKARMPWNSGLSFTRKGDDEVFRSKKAWTDAVIKKRGNSCERCGWSTARCDAHHILPRSKGGLNTIHNARVLCPNCHRIQHEIERVA